MQKKIIALAIASALTVPALALAETSNANVYGQVNVSYDFTKTGGSNGTNVNKVSTNESRFGLKGSEDLGDGLSAVWQIEQAISVDTGGDQLASRNTFAGLSSKSAGTVILGRNDSPAKLATRKLDVFGDTTADNRALLGKGNAAGSGFDPRLDNVIMYTSPDLNGFKAAIAYSNLTESNTNSTQAKLNTVSLSGTYDVAPFYAALGYEKHELTSTTDEKATKLGLGYKMDSLQVNFIYEKIDDDTVGATNKDHNAYYLAGVYSFGNDAVKAAYTKSKSITNIANTGAKQWSLGYDHNMSKRTKLYALYTKLDNDSAQNYGMKFNASASGAGADPSAFSFGMKHSF